MASWYAQVCLSTNAAIWQTRSRTASSGTDERGAPPRDFCPSVEEFTGAGGSLEWPQAVVTRTNVWHFAGRAFEGWEAIGALRFQELTLQPAQTKSYILMLAVMDEEVDPDRLVTTYGSKAKFDEWLQRTKVYWQAKLDTLAFSTADAQFDLWLKWVRLQPILRRQFGNSFLPHHDYGRGGRGWRDLWQDCLALLIMEPAELGCALLANYAGVRIDGSNATIIGNTPGEFLADRNNIPRIWMDHGAWPFLTTKLYIDQSGDLGFLLQEQTYFRDQHIDRARDIDTAWQPEQGTRLLSSAQQVVRGTVLEHLLVQHLVLLFQRGCAQYHPAGRCRLERRHGHGRGTRRERGIQCSVCRQPARPQPDGARLGRESA